MSAIPATGFYIKSCGLLCLVVLVGGQLLYVLSRVQTSFSFCVGAEKKGSGGSPIPFLCSQIYKFWGSLISGDE